MFHQTQIFPGKKSVLRSVQENFFLPLRAAETAVAVVATGLRPSLQTLLGL
jgi:hypothetical protein